MASRSPSAERRIEAGRVEGSVRVPGSKSVTQRALALAALADRGVKISHPLFSDDTRHFAAGLRDLGFVVSEGEAWFDVVPERGARSGRLWCGAGGTMMRLMTGVLAARPGSWTLDGVPRLRERPLAPLLEALRGLGAEIRCLEVEGHPPLRIEGGIDGGRVAIDASASSQFLSAALLAGVGAKAPVELRVQGLTSRPYVDLTRAAIRRWGGRVEVDGDLWRVEPGLAADLREIEIEGDWSSAAYPAAAAALTGGEILLLGLDAQSLQGDRRFLALLEEMGARVAWGTEGILVGGTGRLEALDVSMSDIPDQVPTLAALAPFCRGTTRIRDVAHLRIKESDRLRAMATELRRLGVRVEELEDGLRIEGGFPDGPPEDVCVETWDDHRIAMSLAVLGLGRGALRVSEPEVVSKSWPGFWDAFDLWIP